MTLSDLSSLGNLVSALAVAGSLVYLGLQTHQSAKHSQALIAQGRVTRSTESLLRMAGSDIAGAIISRYGIEPTVENIRNVQIAFLISSQIANADESFEQYNSGLLSHYQFASFRGNMVGVFGLPGFRDAWERWKIEHPDSNPKFIQFMDDIDAKAPPVSFAALSGGENGARGS
jgi:hypothetical protein